MISEREKGFEPSTSTLARRDARSFGAENGCGDSSGSAAKPTQNSEDLRRPISGGCEIGCEGSGLLRLARARLLWRHLRGSLGHTCFVDGCAEPLTYQIRRRGTERAPGHLRYACEAHRDHDGATVVRRIDCPRWFTGRGVCACGVCRDRGAA